MGITHHIGRSTKSATKYLTDRCTRIDIHRNGIGIFCNMRIPCWSIGFPCSIFVIIVTSPDRVWRIETTTIKFTDDQRLTSIFVCIHGDRAIDTTTKVITTEDTTELTAGYCQRDITINNRILSTAEHLRNEILWHTFQCDVDIAIHRSYLTSTIDFLYLQRTSWIDFFSLQRCSTTNITLGITTTIYVTNLTTFQFCFCDTGTIDTS